MKYWWILEYIPFFETVDEKGLRSKKGKNTLNRFLSDYAYHLSIPVHYLTYFKKIRNYPISKLSDCGLQMILAYYIYQGKIEEGLLQDAILSRKIFEILSAMKKIPDTSLPATDYTISDMVEEINNLSTLTPTVERVKHSNVGACYSCRNIFYTDAIYQKNKKGECICPYCDATMMYFDTDFIPMDSNFIMLAYLMRQTEIPFSSLISMLDKVSIDKTGPIDYSFSDGDYKIEGGQISFPFVKAKMTLTSIYEDYLSTSIYHILDIHDNQALSKSIFISLDEVHYNIQTPVFALTTLLSILYYFSKHYFHSIEKIHLILSNQEIYSVYVSTLEALSKRQH